MIRKNNLYLHYDYFKKTSGIHCFHEFSLDSVSYSIITLLVCKFETLTIRNEKNLLVPV